VKAARRLLRALYESHVELAITIDWNLGEAASSPASSIKAPARAWLVERRRPGGRSGFANPFNRHPCPQNHGCCHGLLWWVPSSQQHGQIYFRTRNN